MKKIIDVIFRDLLVIYSNEINIPLDGRRITISQLVIVAKESDGDDSWKAYCGVMSRRGVPQEQDLDIIMKQGCSLQETQARSFFPQLNHLNYRS